MGDFRDDEERWDEELANSGPDDDDELDEDDEIEFESFVLKIKCGNEAMGGPEDIADALEKAALSVLEQTDGVIGFPIRDRNGNTVGSWTLYTRK